MGELLTCNKISIQFGGLVALNQVDLSISEGEIVGLIGPNGAGKTTFFNCISGHYRPNRGEILFLGKNITYLPKRDICRSGISRTFQIPRPFRDLTVLQNVLIGAIFGNMRQINSERDASDAIGFVGLKGKENTLARSLTIHDLRALELARALATSPRLLLLDEVVAGLNLSETRDFMDLIQTLRNDKKITVLWIEHVMKAIMGIADRVIVLHQGAKLAEGSPGQVAQDKRVVESYLGEG